MMRGLYETQKYVVTGITQDLLTKAGKQVNELCMSMSVWQFLSLKGNFSDPAVMVTPLSYETDILRFGLDECIINWL